MGDESSSACAPLVLEGFVRFLVSREANQYSIGFPGGLSDHPPLKLLDSSVKKFTEFTASKFNAEPSAEHLTPILNGFDLSGRIIIASILYEWQDENQNAKIGILYMSRVDGHRRVYREQFLMKCIGEISDESIVDFAKYNEVMRNLGGNPIQVEKVMWLVDWEKFSTFPQPGNPMKSDSKPLKDHEIPKIDLKVDLSEDILPSYLSELLNRNVSDSEVQNVSDSNVLVNFKGFTRRHETKPIGHAVIYQSKTGYGVFYTTGMFLNHDPDFHQFVDDLNMGKGIKTSLCKKIKNDKPSLREFIPAPANFREKSKNSKQKDFWERPTSKIEDIIMEGDKTGDPLHVCLKPLACVWARFINTIVAALEDSQAGPSDESKKSAQTRFSSFISRYFSYKLHVFLVDLIEGVVYDNTESVDYFDLNQFVAYYINCKQDDQLKVIEQNKDFEIYFNIFFDFLVNRSEVAKAMRIWIPKNQTSPLLYDEYDSSNAHYCSQDADHQSDDAAEADVDAAPDVASAKDSAGETSQASIGSKDDDDHAAKSAEEESTQPVAYKKRSPAAKSKPAGTRKNKKSSRDSAYKPGRDSESESLDSDSDCSEDSFVNDDVEFNSNLQALRREVLNLTRACWDTLVAGLIRDCGDFLVKHSQPEDGFDGSELMPYTEGSTVCELCAFSMLFVEKMAEHERKKNLSSSFKSLFIPGALICTDPWIERGAPLVFDSVQLISKLILNSNFTDNVFSLKKSFDENYDECDRLLSDIKAIELPSERRLIDFFFKSMSAIGGDLHSVSIETAMGMILTRLQSGGGAPMDAPAKQATSRKGRSKGADEDEEANKEHLAAAAGSVDPSLGVSGSISERTRAQPGDSGAAGAPDASNDVTTKESQAGPPPADPAPIDAVTGECHSDHIAAESKDPDARDGADNVGDSGAGGETGDGGAKDGADTANTAAGDGEKKDTADKPKKNPQRGRNAARELQALLNMIPVTASENQSRARTQSQHLDPSKGETVKKSSTVLRGHDIPGIKAFKEDTSQEVHVFSPVLQLELLQLRDNDKTFPSRRLEFQKVKVLQIVQYKIVPSKQYASEYVYVGYRCEDGSERRFFVDIDLVIEFTDPVFGVTKRAIAPKPFRIALRPHPAKLKQSFALFILKNSEQVLALGEQNTIIQDLGKFYLALERERSKENFNPSVPIIVDSTLQPRAEWIAEAFDCVMPSPAPDSKKKRESKSKADKGPGDTDHDDGTTGAKSGVMAGTVSTTDGPDREPRNAMGGDAKSAPPASTAASVDTGSQGVGAGQKRKEPEKETGDQEEKDVGIHEMEDIVGDPLCEDGDSDDSSYDINLQGKLSDSEFVNTRVTKLRPGKFYNRKLVVGEYDDSSEFLSSDQLTQMILKRMEEALRSQSRRRKALGADKARELVAKAAGDEEPEPQPDPDPKSDPEPDHDIGSVPPVSGHETESGRSPEASAGSPKKVAAVSKPESDKDDKAEAEAAEDDDDDDESNDDKSDKTFDPGEVTRSTGEPDLVKIDSNHPLFEKFARDVMKDYVMVDAKFNVGYIVLKLPSEGGRYTVVFLNLNGRVTQHAKEVVSKLLLMNPDPNYRKIIGPVKVIVNSEVGKGSNTIIDLSPREVVEFSNGSECVLCDDTSTSLQSFVAAQLSVDVEEVSFRTLFSLCPGWKYSDLRNPLQHTCKLFERGSRTIGSLAQVTDIKCKYYPFKCQFTRENNPMCSSLKESSGNALLSRFKFIGDDRALTYSSGCEGENPYAISIVDDPKEKGKIKLVIHHVPKEFSNTEIRARNKSGPQTKDDGSPAAKKKMKK